MYLEISSACIFFVYCSEADLTALLLKQKGVLKQKYHYINVTLMTFTCSQKKGILIQASTKAHFLIKKIKNKIKNKPQSSASR